MVNEPLFVLLCGMPCSPDRLLVYVVLWIFVDLLKSGCSLFVNPEMVLVEGSLPSVCVFVVDGGCSLIGSERCIPLSPSEVHLGSSDFCGCTEV